MPLTNEGQGFPCSGYWPIRESKPRVPRHSEVWFIRITPSRGLPAPDLVAKGNEPKGYTFNILFDLAAKVVKRDPSNKLPLGYFRRRRFRLGFGAPDDTPFEWLDDA